MTGKRLVALALLAAACASTTPTAPPPPSLPAPARTASRVVLMSFDGLGADAVASYPLPALKRLPLQARVKPVEPTATAPTHAAILTGAEPHRSGILSNLFHRRGTPPREAARGMDSEIETETLLDAARRSGKRVGSIAFPTVDGTSPRRRADFGVSWTKPLTAARILTLTSDDFRREWLPPGWTAAPRQRNSFSPIRRARIEWRATPTLRSDVDLIAYDTTDDQVVNYDTIRAEISDTEIPHDAAGWFPVQRRADDGLYGSWSRVLRHDPGLATVTLYWGAISRGDAYPESFRALVEERAGFWPGAPDEQSVRERLRGGGGISANDFSVQLKRMSEYLTRATVAAIERGGFDLLLTYQPAVDQAGHQFLMALETQLHTTAENLAAAAAIREEACRHVDGAVAAITAAIDPSADAVVVTGDHGLTPVDREVRLNRVLQERGLAKREGDGFAADTRWGAYATGQVAHFYRFAGPDDSADVVKLLTSLRADDGASVFERVIRRDDQSHRDMGDVVAYAWPRFALSSAFGDSAFVRPVYYGQHGGLTTHREFDTILAAGGAGIEPVTIPSVRQTKIARFISALLGIDPPRDAE